MITEYLSQFPHPGKILQIFLLTTVHCQENLQEEVKFLVVQHVSWINSVISYLHGSKYPGFIVFAGNVYIEKFLKGNIFHIMTAHLWFTIQDYC